MTGLRARVPPGRAQGGAALGRAPDPHRHRQHARHARGAGRPRSTLGVRRFVHASSSSVYGGAAPSTDAGGRAAPPPVAVRRVEARGRGVLPRVRRALRARDRRAALLQRVRAAPAPRRDLRGGDPAVHRRAAQRARARSCTATAASRATSPTSPTSSTRTSRRRAPRPSACSGRVYNVAAGNEWSLLDILRVLGELLGVEPGAAVHRPAPRRRAPQPRRRDRSRARPRLPRRGRARRRPAPDRRLAPDARLNERRYGVEVDRRAAAVPG